MIEITPIMIGRSGPNLHGKSTAPDKVDRVAVTVVIAFAILSFAYWWPTFADVARFAFLCCFPAVFPFCYALVRSAPSLRERWKSRVLTIVVGVHCILLAGLVVAWIKFSSSVTIRDPEVVFGFMVVEVAVILLLGRVLKHKTNEE
jgi:hypothetical protein